MRTITLEEHYATPAFLAGPGQQLVAQAQGARAHPQVAAGIDVQVLSLTAPGVEQLDAPEAVALAREANDLLAEAVPRHRDRLAGFAAVPLADPRAAAGELERVEALRVPLYLHPTWPPQQVMAGYVGIYPPEVAGALATSAWAWHIDTATHILRMILSGAFDRYPALQVVIGHMGESLAFMLPRLELALPRR